MTETNPEQMGLTTQWTNVIKALQENPKDLEKHLGELCRQYRKYLYYILREYGRNHHDAEDLTMSFIEEKIPSLVLIAQKEKGRFRGLLRRALWGHNNDWLKRQRAQKRGGDVVQVSLQEENEEGKPKYSDEDEKTKVEASKESDRKLAAEVVSTAFQRLLEEYSDRAALIPELFRVGIKEQGYPELTERFGESRENLRTIYFRSKGRFRVLLRHEIGRMAGVEDLEDELRYLLGISGFDVTLMDPVEEDSKESEDDGDGTS